MPQPLRLAFMGFRHGHVLALYKLAKMRMDVQIVAACEEHPETAGAIGQGGVVALTHKSFDDLLNSADCDAIAIGDYFARRGSLIIRALKAGKHVIIDKPICTSMEELEQIEQLARQNNRCIGCLFDLRDSGAYRAMRRLIREGTIGEVHTVNFTAEHPLLPGSRPGWYFEPGKHGGTITDIAIHAMDLLPWITGRRITECVAARVWNARLPQYPHFQDGAQLMLKMDNNGGILGDVSYLAPNGCGYGVPQYWRLICHGAEGVLETRCGGDTLSLTTHSDKQPRTIPADPNAEGCVLDDFLHEISGRHDPERITTQGVIDAHRRVLKIQQAADLQRTHVLLDK
jgi:predicted dehydrogenase